MACGSRLLAVALFSVLVSGLVSAQAESETSPLRWVLQSTSGRQGEAFGAWLISSNPTTPLNATVNSPFSAVISPVTTANCDGAATAKGSGSWHDQLAPGGTAYFCVTPNSAGTFRLVATASYVSAVNGSPVTLHAVAVSDVYHSSPPWEFGPSSSAALGALGGFVLGLASFWAQQALKAKADDRDVERALEKQSTELLVGELLRNREKLFDVVVNKAQPVKVETGAYNNMSGAMKLLISSRQRGTYFKKLQQLYGGPISAYNDGIDNAVKDIQARAAAALAALDDLK
jgi:hypothetical protein